MTRVYVGVGSNIEPERNVVRGLAMLHERFGPLTVSTAWRTAAVAMQSDTAPFINLVVGFESDLDVTDTRAELDRIEAACGRQPKASSCGESASRELDLDLLLFGDLVRSGQKPEVPRSDIVEYAFVYEPLLEIAPGIVHPESGRRLAELRDELQLAGTDMKRVTIDW